MADLSDNFKKFIENIELTQYQVEDGKKKQIMSVKHCTNIIMRTITMVQQS